MSVRHRPGGVVHTYQKYDPRRFPSPTSPPPDLVSPALEHMLMFGNMRQLTDEELARAVRLDPSQIAGLGPSLDALIAMLLERKSKILQTYQTDSVLQKTRLIFHRVSKQIEPPVPLRKRFRQAVQDEQIYDLERLWYDAEDDSSTFSRQMVQLIERLSDKYEIEELAAKYDFTGRTPLTVEEALVLKQELEQIDELLKQLEQARETAQIGLIDMEALAAFTEPGDLAELETLRETIEDYVRELAERQGLERDGGAFRLTPQAYRIFQGRLLERIFSHLEASRSGRHQGPVVGEGAVEIPQTKPYEFGDSLTHMDIPQSFVNAMLREGGGCQYDLRQKTLKFTEHVTRRNVLLPW